MDWRCEECGAVIGREEERFCWPYAGAGEQVQRPAGAQPVTRCSEVASWCQLRRQEPRQLARRLPKQLQCGAIEASQLNEAEERVLAARTRWVAGIFLQCWRHFSHEPRRQPAALGSKCTEIQLAFPKEIHDEELESIVEQSQLLVRFAKQLAVIIVSDCKPASLSGLPR